MERTFKVGDKVKIFDGSGLVRSTEVKGKFAKHIGIDKEPLIINHDFSYNGSSLKLKDLIFTITKVNCNIWSNYHIGDFQKKLHLDIKITFNNKSYYTSNKFIK